MENEGNLSGITHTTNYAERKEFSFFGLRLPSLPISFVCEKTSDAFKWIEREGEEERESWKAQQSSIITSKAHSLFGNHMP